MKVFNLSEDRAAKLAEFSRLTWRAVTKGKQSVELSSLIKAAQALGCDITVLASPQDEKSNRLSDCSTVGVGFCVLRDGQSSWKIHYMNLVDEFRRTLDARLLLLPPPNDLAIELRALLASIVMSLCLEAEIETPGWARKRYDLPKPWFIAEIESLKAMTILESPLPFRRNNIFVGSNFLERV